MRRGKNRYRHTFVEPLENRVLLSNVPNGPFGLTATASSATSVNLAFYDSATNETGFTVQRSTSQNGIYTTVANLPASPGTSGKVTYTDNSAVGSTTYFYKVFAVNPPYSSSATTASVTTPSGGPVTAPTAPTNITASLAGNNIQISFTDNSNNEADFVLQRSTSPSGPFTTIATITGDAATGTKNYTDSNVTVGSTYYYQIYAENTAGPSSIAGPTSGVTVPVPTPPAAPSGLSAALSGSSVVVSFTDNSNNENDFVVQRSTSASGPFATVGTVTGTSTTGARNFTDSSVAANTTYFYQIFAENGAGPSSIIGPSNSVTTPANTGPNPGGAPNGPFGFSASATSANSVSLSFFDSASNETGFVIQRATSASGPFTTIANLPPSPGTSQKVTYTDTTTVGSTTYFYKLYAVNGPYQSSVSNTSVTTPAGGAGPTAPAAPSNLATTLSGSSIIVSFTDNSTNENDFQLLRSTSAAGPFVTVTTITGDAATGAKQYADNSVAAGTTYYYEVFAENAAGPSSIAGPTNGVTTPPAQSTPNDPSNLNAALSGNNVLVTFTDNSTNESDFQILRSTSATGPFSQLTTITGDSLTGSKQYTDTSVLAGTTYYYEIFAENAVGPSSTVGPTSGVTTPPQITPPATPTNVTASLSGSQVIVNFTDNSNNESDFVILRSTTQNGTYTSVGTVTGDSATGTKSFTDSTVAAGTTYFYEVYAENSGGKSATAGPSAGVTTPGGGTNPGGTPNGPYVFSATAVSATQVNLVFYDSANNETGFVIQRSTNPSGGFAPIATLPPSPGTAGKVTYTDTATVGSTTYYYQVYAINGPYKSGVATTNVTTPAGGGGGGGGTNNVDATKLSGNEMESQIAINPINPNNIVLVAQNDVNNSNMVDVSRSTDGGKTWTVSTLGGAQDGFAVNTQRPDARVIFDAFGNLYITYMVGASDGIHLVGFRSSDGGASFTYLGSLVGGSDGVSPDDPALATGVYAGNTATQGIWVIYDDDNSNRVDLIGGTSSGLGQFSPGIGPVIVSDSLGAYASLTVGPNGQLAAAWQNQKYGNSPNQIIFDVDPTGIGTGFGTDKTVGTTNVGAFYPIPAQPDRTIDANVNLAFDNSNDATRGRLYLVYTDNTTGFANDTDIELRYTDNLGGNWTSPLRVNNDTTHNSQFLPALAVDPTTGHVGVSWYDARNSANDTTTQLYVGVSTDHGATFSNTQIATGTSNQAWANSGVNDLDYGDNGSLAFFGGSLIPSWSDNSNVTGGNPNGTDSRFDIYVDILKT